MQRLGVEEYDRLAEFAVIQMRLDEDRASGRDSRRQTIIPVLSDDTVGYVLNLLDTAGGSAVMVLTGDTMRIATLCPVSEARLTGAAEDDLVTEVHEGSRVDVFFALLEQTGSAVVRRVAARLVDHGPIPVS
ncbi:MAG: hypothetical protein LC808_15460 [Actinobacteria bacterium]|nr:hypothetical protein [Actinomycetota bacterium]